MNNPQISFPGEQFHYNQQLYSWKSLLQNGPGILEDLAFGTFCLEWAHGQKAFELRTSGSTGTPKVIKLSRQQMETSARMTINHLSLGSHHRALICLDTNFIAGKMMVVRALLAKMEIEGQSPSSNPFTKLLPSGKNYFAALVPMQMDSIIQRYGTQHPVHQQISKVLIGGGPVSYQLEEKIKELPFEVFLTYGMTETVSHIALKRLNGPLKSDYFRVFPGVEIEKDRENRLRIKAEVTNGEWIQTNDLVNIVDHLHFQWLGRRDNVINSGGIKINPEPLESEIARLFHSFGIERNFYLQGITDHRLGQKLVLVIEGERINREVESLLKEEMLEIFDKYQQPKEIRYLNRFARTPTGKILRNQI